MRRLVLRSFQSPGDILMLTAAVRDLHKAHSGQFLTDVRTSCDDLWRHNPWLTSLHEEASGVEQLDMHYPLIHQANQLPYHFIHGYRKYLEDRLGLRIPPSQFCGDVHLTESEKDLQQLRQELGVDGRYWIIMAGGKYDFTAKWWSPDAYQQVVDRFREDFRFVQCGQADHWHPRLSGVVDLIGKTSIRQFIRLMYGAEGVVCPVTFAMHLAAAVETPSGRPPHRACVVIAGGREPAHWEAYPHHQFLSTNGALSCCSDGGCWKSRCQPVDDGDSKNFNLCEQPVEVRTGLTIPRCMDMITPADVIRRIEMYLEGGALNGNDSQGPHATSRSRQPPRKREHNPQNPASTPNRNKASRISHSQPSAVAKIDVPQRQSSLDVPGTHSVRFYHGLGDAAYFAKLIPMYTRRGHQVAVECTPDKGILFQAAGATVLPQGAASQEHAWAYPADHRPRCEHGHFWRGSKMGHNISEFPLPNIGRKDELWDEYVSTTVDVASHIGNESHATVRRWFERLQTPIVLFHQKGNTARQRKSLPDQAASVLYERFIDQCDGTLILLDWDQQVPRLASHRVRHLEDLGSCTTELMLAMMLQADLMVGVDSGPLHSAHLAGVPAMGVWMPGHYPSTYTLPRSNQLNVVLADETAEWNRYKRIPWRIVEHPGREYTGDGLARLVRKMLEPPRYLPDDRAADVQLQQFVREFCRCRGTSSLARYWDRHRSFDVLLREMTQRFDTPTVVETGTIRAEEDWGGAGFFTYLMGAYLYHRGGTLDSVDIGASNCEFARQWTEVFQDTVRLHCEDSLTFLARFQNRVDVFYVDSLDTTEPNHAEHALQEVQLLLPHLAPDSLIVFDDSPWHAGATVGKGAKAVPWLLEQGWKVLYSGYQVILSRSV